MFVMGVSVLSGHWRPVIAEDPGWPREYSAAGRQIVLYQPQVDEWKNQETLSFRSVVAVKDIGQDKPTLGVIEVTTTTRVNTYDRTVLLTDPQAKVTFPDVDAGEAAKLEALVRGALPNRQTLEVDLDRVLSYVKMSEIQKRDVEVNLEPPPIFYSESPAILVIFMGEPRFKPVAGTNLLFAANTNWNVFLETGSSRYYLLNGDGWLTTADPKTGAWDPARTLPDDFAKLPDDENWSEAREHVNAQPPATGMAVFVSKSPAELIITEGEVELTPIPGTELFVVANTDSDLFFNSKDRGYYFLVAGRWFRAEKLAGPWTAATTDLPASFAKIPDDHTKADVLASVPGTPEAAEAVIQASIPQKATVQRADAKVDVTFDGDPVFKPIEGSKGVSYATNTTFTVLKVGKQLYCCESGVWFVSPQAKGPWVVCAKVPDAIYSIPSTSPFYNVTYVYVYNSTPDTVTVGYTSGYEGAYVAKGLLMFGAGMALGYALGDHDDNWYAWHYSPCFYSYGCHARYSYYGGGYVRTAHYYGPYGGAGYGARYNPITGGFARAAYAYGPYRSAGVGAAYNPVTGRYARGGYVSGPGGTVAGGSVYNPRTGAGAATRQVNTPYGSWGRSVVSDGDDWARFGHRSGEYGKTGGFQTSEGAKGIVHKGDNGWNYVGKSADGDLYAGRDGNVYRRDDSDRWQTHSNTSRDWNTTGNTSYARQQSRVRPDSWDNSYRTAAPASPQQNRVQRDVPTQRDTRWSPSNSYDLNRDAWSRDRGNRLSEESGLFRGGEGRSRGGRGFGGRRR
jgi:hypothetical protein